MPAVAHGKIFPRRALSLKFALCMKLLVFAHTPPPHHGQSYMVHLMLEGFGGDHRRQKPAAPHPLGIECYHVNARFSRGLEDIGEFQGTKMLLIFWYCMQAIWVRFRYGVKTFYYVPAPGKKVALYRDWLVMLLCRPVFKTMIFHWHAAGLAKWLEVETPIIFRTLTYRLARPVDLSIVLSRYNLADAQKLLSRHISVVPGGRPDPCPDFSETLLPQRQARCAARQKLFAGQPADAGFEIVNVLYLALVSREKGVFDSVEGVALANEKLAAAKSPLRFRLTVMGAFASADEETELLALIETRRLQPTVELLGFVPAERKAAWLRDADIFCFPTYYLAENQPGNLIEALAHGLPIVTTRWRSVPEMLPENYPGLVDIRSPAQVADALIRLAVRDDALPLREIFLRQFTLEKHLAGMAAAIKQAAEGKQEARDKL